MPSAATISRVQGLINSSKIFVAAKTYCPYCQATLKTLFEEKKVDKKLATVLELNQLEDGSDIQDALAEITGQKTVPNIFINGKHIGGNSDLQELNNSGDLDKLLASL